MPLIRYKTDDVCLTANDGTVSIIGRRDVNDFLIGVNDEKIYNSSLHFLSDILINVTNYQFIQEEKGKSVLLIVPNKDFTTSEIAFIKKEIEKKTKGIIDFEIKVVNSLQLSSRGKFKRFISNIKND